MKNKFLKLVAAIVAIFGLLSIFAGGSVILDLFEMRAKEGNYVLFVVWVNLICGFLYLIAAYGLFKQRKWTSIVLGLGIILLIGAFLGLFIWINQGGIYESKTVGAMTFRTLFTIAMFVIAKKNKL